MISLKEAELRIARLHGQLEAYEEDVKGVTERLVVVDKDVDELSTILDILQGMESAWRERFQQGLETIVSQGLTAVFGEDIKVRLEATTQRDATSIAIKVEQGGVETDVMDAKGGSLVQVLSFLLIVLLVVSSQPPLRRTVILDEPFGMVSTHYFPRLCELITQLNAQLGMQFIMTTHNMELLACAQRAYEVYCNDGAAQLRELETS